MHGTNVHAQDPSEDGPEAPTTLIQLPTRERDLTAKNDGALIREIESNLRT